MTQLGFPFYGSANGGNSSQQPPKTKEQPRSGSNIIKPIDPTAPPTPAPPKIEIPPTRGGGLIPYIDPFPFNPKPVIRPGGSILQPVDPMMPEPPPAPPIPGSGIGGGIIPKPGIPVSPPIYDDPPIKPTIQKGIPPQDPMDNPPPVQPGKTNPPKAIAQPEPKPGFQTGPVPKNRD